MPCLSYILIEHLPKRCLVLMSVENIVTLLTYGKGHSNGNLLIRESLSSWGEPVPYEPTIICQYRDPASFPAFESVVQR